MRFNLIKNVCAQQQECKYMCCPKPDFMAYTFILLPFSAFRLPSILRGIYFDKFLQINAGKDSFFVIFIQSAL